MLDLPAYQTVAWLGFAAGLAFGAIAQRTNFCTMGALSDILYMGSFVRLRMWLLAMAVAIAGSQGLAHAGLVDLGASIYLTPSLGWLGAIVGGLLFGFGMTIAGGCGNRNLVRLGAGNLKSLVVLLVVGVFAYMTLRGLTGALRVAAIEPAALDLRRAGLETQGLPAFLAAAGLAPGVARLAATAIVVAGLLAFCLSDGEFRRRTTALAGGIAIGLIVVAGWAITGIAGADDFEPVPLASFTFIGPTGEALVYAMTWTGAKINFGIATVLGVVCGAFLAARASGEFRVEAFTDVADMKRHLVGAALMGAGGVTALGCTIGQGLTGVSTLAVGSILAVLSICAGGYAGFKYLEEGSLSGAVRAIAGRA